MQFAVKVTLDDTTCRPPTQPLFEVARHCTTNNVSKYNQSIYWIWHIYMQTNNQLHALTLNFNSVLPSQTMRPCDHSFFQPANQSTIHCSFSQFSWTWLNWFAALVLLLQCLLLHLVDCCYCNDNTCILPYFRISFQLYDCLPSPKMRNAYCWALRVLWLLLVGCYTSDSRTCTHTNTQIHLYVVHGRDIVVHYRCCCCCCCFIYCCCCHRHIYSVC